MKKGAILCFKNHNTKDCFRQSQSKLKNYIL